MFLISFEQIHFHKIFLMLDQLGFSYGHFTLFYEFPLQGGSVKPSFHYNKTENFRLEFKQPNWRGI